MDELKSPEKIYGQHDGRGDVSPQRLWQGSVPECKHLARPEERKADITKPAMQSARSITAILGREHGSHSVN